MKKLILLLLAVITFTGARADEGMWMLPLIEKLNIQQMQEMGSTLSAEEIYSDRNISLKDAIIVFGGGCTGVVVSNQGLIFTNHHCGYGAIQQLSSVEHNYLKNGFTAQQLTDEIPAPGLIVKFLVSITEVTDRVLESLPETLDAKTRQQKQDSVVKVIKDEFSKDNNYIVQVRSFYAQNEFFVFVMEEFRDVRLAYTPPTSIGKFGGDTDNWMWPRHTGDFSVFRVYTDAMGKPADYSENNVPFIPKRFAAISTKGYQPNDFAMILGNPGSTSRYLTSWGIRNRTDAVNIARIDVRGDKQAVWRSFMRDDEAINIAYASKFARSSNYWKNSIGMNQAIEKLDVIAKKQAEEKEFQLWVDATPERKAKYGNVLNDIRTNADMIFPNYRAMNFLRESFPGGVEMPVIASRLERLMDEKVSNDSVLNTAKRLYRDYYAKVDEATLTVMLETYRKHVDAQFLPAFYQVIDKKYKGDYARYAKYIFSKSAFSDFDTFSRQLSKNKIKTKKDPALLFSKDVDIMMKSLRTAEYARSWEIIDNAERLLEAGLKEINTANGTSRYPDANFTMRLTYGSISGYNPADAVSFNYYSTTKGIIEKEIPGDMEFDVPAKLKEAIMNKDFGTYADAQTGELMVNFLSNNDITGGNSGSPIFNGKGELLGLAFDGNWEAMSGDIVFEPELQRTINVDVRYMLFIMDKIGGADRLLKELLIY